MSKIARLGLFILTSLLLLSMAIFMIGDRRLLFSTTYRLRAAFDSVAGLPYGGDVRVGGVRQGMVEDIRLPSHPGEKVLVVMHLEKATRGVIKKDSVASIQTEGLLGSKFVSVSFGSTAGEPIQDGDTIAAQPPLDFSDLIKKSDDILNSTKATTANLESVTDKVKRGEGTVGALVNDKRVYDELRDAVAQAKTGMISFQEDMQALKGNFFLRGFFRKRGYSDSAELTKHEIATLPEGPFLKRFVYGGQDLFEKPDTAKLKNEGALDRVGQFLEKTPFGIVVVASYTGMTGEKDKNLVLTQARAMVVRKYLADKFRIDDKRLRTKGMGEDTQNVEGKTNRLEIVVYPGGTDKLAKANASVPKASGRK